MHIEPRSVYENTLSTLRASKVSADIIRKIEQDWGRLKRPLRINIIIFYLMIQAESRKTRTYTDISILTEMGSKYERDHILIAIAQICHENNWPPYTALIQRGSPQPTELLIGEGFFTQMTKFGYVYSDKAAFHQECKQRCFEEPIPDQVEVLKILAAYYP